jgi:hypothetical protein
MGWSRCCDAHWDPRQWTEGSISRRAPPNPISCGRPSQLEQTWIAAQKARQEVIDLIRRRPLFPGDAPAAALPPVGG